MITSLNITLVGFVTSMNSQMSLKYSFLIKGLKTILYWTFEGFLFVVSPHMDLISVEFTVAFIAVWKTADIGFNFKVNIWMWPKMRLTNESLWTFRALVWLVISMNFLVEKKCKNIIKSFSTTGGKTSIFLRNNLISSNVLISWFWYLLNSS